MTFIEWGALCFGVVIGWFTYFVNRHREKVTLADVATIVGALGGAAIITLFPEESTLFAAYGIGLFVGFFGYFGTLILLVRSQPGWTMAWFLDGLPPKERGAGDGVPSPSPVQVASSKQRPMEGRSQP